MNPAKIGRDWFEKHEILTKEEKIRIQKINRIILNMNIPKLEIVYKSIKKWNKE